MMGSLLCNTEPDVDGERHASGSSDKAEIVSSPRDEVFARYPTIPTLYQTFHRSAIMDWRQQAIEAWSTDQAIVV
jgi:hypothetical protein